VTKTCAVTILVYEREVFMSKFECHDLGMSCSYAVTGETVGEVRQKAIDHARKAHVELFAGATTPEARSKIEKTIEMKIKQV
jgi:predicted small metal-binding protein